MDAIGLTAISVALLVWIEIRSSRNRAGQPNHNPAPARIAEAADQEFAPVR